MTGARRRASARCRSGAMSRHQCRLVLMLLCAWGAAGCAAAFAPRGMAGQLTWTVEHLQRTQDSTVEETRWAYTLAITNHADEDASLFRSALTLALDGVYLSPELEDIQLRIPRGGTLRLPHTAVFARVRFSDAGVGSAGGSPQFKGPYVYWQFLGRYASRRAIILNIDFIPR